MGSPSICVVLTDAFLFTRIPHRSGHIRISQQILALTGSQVDIGSICVSTVKETYIAINYSLFYLCFTYLGFKCSL